MKTYILSILAASLCCGILRSIADKIGANRHFIQHLCGIALAITLMAPVANLKIKDISGMINSQQAETERLIEEGVNLSSDQLHRVIKEQTESYILEKASLYNCEIQVDLQLSDDTIPIPKEVSIKGNISPYARNQLSQILQNDLGIPKENQQWIYQK